MIYDKLYVQSKAKLIRSVASDGLTNIYKRQVSLNIHKRAQINLVEKKVSRLKMKVKIKTNQVQN